MPRRVYTKRTVVVRPKKKWASIMRSMTVTNTLTSGNNFQVNSSDLVKNSVDSNTPTPVIIKAGNIKVFGQVNHTVSASNIQLLNNVILNVLTCPSTNLKLDLPIIYSGC